MNVASPLPFADQFDARVAAYAPRDLDRLGRTFRESGFVRIPDFMTSALHAELLDDCEAICATNGKDKNLLMKSTNNTPRRMRTVGQHVLAEKSRFIPSMYASETFRSFLTILAGQEVLRAPWPPEEYVLSNLFRNGDTHGWHWDDYSFAFVVYLKAPEIPQGGFVQICDGGRWDKANPKVNETLLNGVIHTHRCEAGDAYFLNAQRYLHRVTPIANGGERLIVNMTWASAIDLETDMTHETNDVLFAN